MPPVSGRSLLALCQSAASDRRWLEEGGTRVTLDLLRHHSGLSQAPESLRGRSVLLASRTQLPSVLAAVALDGLARRIVLCLPDVPAAQLDAIVADAAVDAVVTDGTVPALAAVAHVPVVACGADARGAPTALAGRDVATEWVLFTSGTTGQPRMVLHTLAGLSGPLDDGLAVPSGAIWSTFYDVRRYGGLQILLRALLGGGSMLLSAADPVATLLQRAGAAGVTHMSGTPSHWRRALMSPAAHAMAPGYVRLSGEIADQAVLDQLRRTYAGSSVAHAFASTEAGVAFDVRDGLAGFPAALLGQAGAAEMRLVDGTLRIRSGRTAARYLGEGAAALHDPDGFVDTGDLVEQRGERCHFVGRRGGVINVGGQKVSPEEVEAVINRQPGIRMSRVRGRPSPIAGALVAADLVLEDGPGSLPTVRAAVLQACRAALPAHKVPASLHAVDMLPMTQAGKLRRDA